MVNLKKKSSKYISIVKVWKINCANITTLTAAISSSKCISEKRGEKFS